MVEICPFPIDIFLKGGYSKGLCVLSEMLVLLLLGNNPQHLISQTEFCGTLGQSSLKSINQDCSGKTATNGIQD
jgi:hypothetical protein